MVLVLAKLSGRMIITMSYRSIQTGYIDLEFQPNIKPLLTKRFRGLFKAMRFSGEGTPYSTIDKSYHAALWVGRRPNKFGEHAVLSACLPVSSELCAESAVWFRGLVQQNELDLAQNNENPDFRTTSLASYAIVGPEELGDALVIMNMLYTRLSRELPID